MLRSPSAVDRLGIRLEPGHHPGTPIIDQRLATAATAQEVTDHAKMVDRTVTAYWYRHPAKRTPDAVQEVAETVHGSLVRPGLFEGRRRE